MHMTLIHCRGLRKRILPSSLYNGGGGDICVATHHHTYVTNTYWVSVVCLGTQ